MINVVAVVVSLAAVVLGSETAAPARVPNVLFLLSGRRTVIDVAISRLRLASKVIVAP